MQTIRFPTDWIANARDALARLAENPWALFVVLLAINTIARPYAGITHDTRLYSGQVLNRVEGGSYGDDLFFRYGSQDEYSAFSHLAAPVVHAVGLPTAFFLIYLFSKTLLIWGMMRLVQTLVPNRTASTLALGYCMVVPIHYAGMYVLNVQEQFVTPRMFSIALVLIGLDLTLRGRPWLSISVLLAGLAIHPLMAFGGLLVWAAYHLWKHLGSYAFIGSTVAVTALAAGVLAYEPLGKRCFGEMDETWRETIMHASPFNFPSQWGNIDWWFLAFQLAIGCVVAWKFRSVDSDKARFVIVVMLVAVAGAVGAVLAEQLPYALLLQGQPYRVMWILAFLHLAFIFWLFVEWVQQPTLLMQLAGCGLLVYLCSHDGLVVESLFPLFVWPFFVLVLRGLEREPRDAGWLVHSIQLSAIVGGIFWLVYKLVVLLNGLDALAELYPELRDFIEVFLKNAGPVAMLLAVAWLAVRCGGLLSRRAIWLTGAACVGVQAFAFALPETDFYRRHCTRFRSDLQEIHAILHKDRDPSAPLPTVYSNIGCLDYIWLDLHAKSYFDWWQAGNFMFRRDMAIEGQRRACLVAAFELERFRKFKHELTPGEKHLVGRFFKIDFDRVQLSAEDLAQLCREPDIDYLVVEQRFDGLYASQHGRLYLYRCREVRAALGITGPGEVVASAK